jgi:hypothetical protein
MDPAIRSTINEELPKLSAAEFRAYNRFAEQMDLYVWVNRKTVFVTILTKFSITISVKPGTSCIALLAMINGPRT